MPGQNLPQKRAPEHIPPRHSGRRSGARLLEQIGSLTERIRQYNRESWRLLCEERYPETLLLRQVEGIGPLTALTFVLTVGDPYRFEASRRAARSGVPRNGAR